jgi:hypothetical protein
MRCSRKSAHPAATVRHMFSLKTELEINTGGSTKVNFTV